MLNHVICIALGPVVLRPWRKDKLGTIKNVIEAWIAQIIYTVLGIRLSFITAVLLCTCKNLKGSVACGRSLL